MTHVITFTVPGKPQPQGSMRQISGHNFSDNPNLKSYRQAVAWMALEARQKARRWSLDAPMRVEADFWFQRPKSSPTRIFPTVKPDIDKLCRSICDGMTGVLYVDDCQVVEIVARKWYGEPRTEVRIRAACVTAPE